jgi:glycosyltransferase involved in cell wall biosynthesis
MSNEERARPPRWLLRCEIEYLNGSFSRALRNLLRWQTHDADQVFPRLDPDRYEAALEYALTFEIKSRQILEAIFLAYGLIHTGVRHLHAHFADTTTQVAMLASMMTGIPFSFTCHAKDIYLGDPEDLTRKIKRAKFVVTCTSANVTYLQQLVGEAEARKINVVYHGVDVEKFSPGEPTERGSPPQILSVGRLVEKKGFPELLRACAILRSKGHDFRCLIIGEGPERPVLEKQIRHLELTDIVSIPGARSHEEVLDAYRHADVFALPCQVLKNGDRDGIPNVLLEAMAVGLPVVTTPVSGIPELVRHGENGILIPERNHRSLASALEKLLLDADLRLRLGKAARLSVVRDFDSAMHVSQLAAFFSAALRQSDGQELSSVPAS